MTLTASTVAPAPAEGRCGQHRTYFLASCAGCQSAMAVRIQRIREQRR